MLNSSKVQDLQLELNSIFESSDSLETVWRSQTEFFFRLVRTLTDIDGIGFKNSYSRFQYILNNLNLLNNERKILNSFRRFLNITDSSKLQKEDINQSLELLNRLISKVSGESVQNTFDDYFVGRVPQLNLTDLQDIRVLVKSWQDEGSKLIIDGFNVEELEHRIRITIRPEEYPSLSYITKFLEEDRILYFEDIKLRPEATDEFETNFRTLFSVQPDYLLSATELGGCFQYHGNNHQLLLFSKLILSLPGSAALKGSMVGNVLDEAVRGEDEYINTIIKSEKDNALKSANFGSDEMQAIRTLIIGEHAPQLEGLVDQNRESELWIEPTFFSVEYGLQGRIDLLINHSNLNKDIVELKSGSLPFRGLNSWPNHLFQVVSYDMLLESTYGDDREGLNFVYYSKDPVMPNRAITSEFNEKKSILKIRNKVYRELEKLKNNDFSPLTSMTEGIALLPPYSKNDFITFQTKYAQGSLRTVYYNELFAFIIRELFIAKIGSESSNEVERTDKGFSSLWLEGMTVKEERCEVLYDLEIQNINEELGHLTLVLSKDVAHSYRKGDLIVMHPKTDAGYKPLVNHILKGGINEISNDQLVVSLFNKQTDYTFMEGYQYWALEKDIFERNYWSEIGSLFNILQGDAKRLNLLFGQLEPVFEGVDLSNLEGLNENQNAVHANAINAKDYYLLQGPPGTGKTSTFLVNYVRETLAKSDDQVFILAFTNKAVEKICESLKKPRNGDKIEYLRITSRQVEDENSVNNLIEELDHDPDLWADEIQNRRVFVTTVSSFLNNQLLLKNFVRFDNLIVDEASQLTEAKLASILLKFKKYILIGDQKQLPAVITQSDEECIVNNQVLHQYGITDHRISLFERLYNNAVSKGWESAYGQLTTHYRMHDKIALLIQRHYKEELVPGLDNQLGKGLFRFQLQGAGYQEIENHRVVFIETPQDSLSKKNRKEAEIVGKLIKEYINAGIDPEHIGVITPFRAQIAEIKKHLTEDLLNENGIIVDTVERFQGDEKKIIFFSTTVANSAQLSNIQNIHPDDTDATDKKLLVSISRASEQFVMLGCIDALSSNLDYNIVIENAFHIELK